MKKSLIALDTYKYNNKGEVIAGDAKIVKIAEDWLAKTIAPQTIEEFLDEYTFDDSEYYFKEYKYHKEMGTL